MIFSGKFFAGVVIDTNSGLHETRQGGEHVDWWVDLSVVDGAINEDLAFSDVAGEIGDGMGDIIVGHGQDGDLGDGTVAASDTTSALVDGREICVHVTGVTTTSGYFFTGGRDFSEGVSVSGHVGQNGKDVHLLSVGEVLGSGESKSGGDNTFNGGVVSQVHEQDDTVHRAVDLKISLEETRSFLVDSHSGEDDSEVFVGVIVDILVLNEGSLATNLSADFVVRKTSGGEKRDLLTTSDGVHDVDG